MKVQGCSLEGLRLIEPQVFGDARGFFLELWNEKRFQDAGLSAAFVQDNISFSRRGILRGLHFQKPNAQGKLVSALQGELFDVAVDLRRSSATFGKWFAVVLSGDKKQQLYIPPGFAHGFQVVSDTALFHYKCTALYSPKDERTLRWDDPHLAIPWPLPEPVLSDKDRQGTLLRDFSPEHLFD
jgi:dTDP-4-dehydrorhamnose 3,5-epimerase